MREAEYQAVRPCTQLPVVTFTVGDLRDLGLDTVMGVEREHVTVERGRTVVAWRGPRKRLGRFVGVDGATGVVWVSWNGEAAYALACARFDAMVLGGSR